MVGQRGWRRSCSASRLHSRLDRPKCKSVVKDTHDACFIPSLPRVLQTGLWIGPRGTALFLAAEAAFQLPQFSAGGDISRYRPPPSKRRCGLSAGFAARIARSERAIGGIVIFRTQDAPKTTKYQRTKSDVIDESQTKIPQLSGILDFLGLLWIRDWWTG